MKKTMKAALCILSAVTMSAAFAVSASAGTLSREELIEKYMPDGAQDELYFRPGTLEQYYDAEGELMDVYGITQQKMDDMQARFEAGELSQEDAEIESMILANETFDLLRSTDYRVLCFNDYRRGIIFNSPSKPNKQYFVNAEYENGFWYVLQADGTASVVGAEQTDMEGKTMLEIPAEIGGVPVTRIEDRAFEQASSYFWDMTEIVIPDTVEYIGEGAFSWALICRNGKINMPANVKYIGRGAFCESARWLEDEFHVIHLPESLEFIGYRAFESRSANEDYFTSTLGYDVLLGFGLGQSLRNILDMPESLVLIEQDHVEVPLDIRSTYENKSYAEINTQNPETFKEKDLYSWNPVIGSDSALAFCEKYDMTQQSIVPKYWIGVNLHSTFLYDQANFIDMDDVSTYYAQKKTAVPKPAAIAKGSGDADCSGTVDVTDSVLLARYCSEDQDAVLTAEGKANADANGDGTLTMDDVSEILQIIAKLK